MLITIAVIFVVLATFLLIIINMYSDYVSRREQDLRMVTAKANNVVSECEELLLNQAQLNYSKTTFLVLHYRIIRALKRCAQISHGEEFENLNQRITSEERSITELMNKSDTVSAYKAPENDHQAITQLRTIRRLRKILKTEIRAGIPINVTELQREDRRLYLLVLKVNISNLIQKVFEMKRLNQSGSCRQLILKGLEVIQRCGIKDGWLTEKADLLHNILNALDAEHKAKAAPPPSEEEEKKSEDKEEIDALFGDKKKW